MRTNLPFGFESMLVGSQRSDISLLVHVRDKIGKE